MWGGGSPPLSHSLLSIVLWAASGEPPPPPLCLAKAVLGPVWPEVRNFGLIIQKFAEQKCTSGQIYMFLTGPKSGQFEIGIS